MGWQGQLVGGRQLMNCENSKVWQLRSHGVGGGKKSGEKIFSDVAKNRENVAEKCGEEKRASASVGVELVYSKE